MLPGDFREKCRRALLPIAQYGKFGYDDQSRGDGCPGRTQRRDLRRTVSRGPAESPEHEACRG